MKNKTTAALLAFFLGGFGVHKFYLGESGAGIIYLLFCWTFIPGIIAFFEFIFLLVMSDHDFNVKYNGSQSVAPSPQGGFETSRDKAATLSELKNLFDSGVITAEEYESKRRKLLDSI
jgi:TM2 domain-containing membrane protein YozV